MYKINAFIVMCLMFKSCFATAQGGTIVDELIAENAEVVSRMVADGMNLSIPYEVDFIAVFPTEEAADQVAMWYVADSKAGNKFTNIETRPGEEGGMELLLVKSMLVTAPGITEFEIQLIERAKMHGGYADGWGVLSE
jgi:hypothetical protein